MEFEEFLKKVISKIGPNAAFDVSRDARLKAIEEILIKKKIITSKEMENEKKSQLDKVAEHIQKMPPLSKK